MKKRYNPLEVEKTIEEYWVTRNIYDAVKSKSRSRAGNKLFAFLEGPPTTNGFMHVGHARGRTLKDVKLRFMRMKGYYVWDQAGWDTQGLPVELEVEKKLGFKTKRDIERYGIERFITECKKLVDYYLDHWLKASRRLGLWLDYENAYQTRDDRYIESVWAFLKKAYKEGLLYEGLRVVPRCPRCNTALSSHELALGYALVEDPSIYFKLKIDGREKTYFVAWTTTPWTIISNEALVVHPKEEYVEIKIGEEIWIVAEKRLKPFLEEVGIKEYKILNRYKGSALEGLRYLHPLLEEVPYHKKHKEPYHTVLCAEWVSMEEGTGVVHAAPAHGPEDFELAIRHRLEVYTPLREDGYFGEDAGVFKNLWFIDSNRVVIEILEKKKLLVKSGTIEHQYPLCWRCDTRLMYYASRQWFIRISDEVREAMSREVKSMKWAPTWAVSRMLDWVENAKDWCISRERFWGTPLPIWKCSKCGYWEVIGSKEELIERAGADIEELHRPWIDNIELKCKRCGGVMRREPFVVDVWMDSGVAHTAALHQYGLDNLFEKLYPFTWITEAADQTRGWFYTLLVTGVIWHGRAPYKSVLLQGHVLDRYGKKMSKSRGNVVWAYDWMQKFGTDPMRIFLLSRAPWDSINFDPDEIKRFNSYLDIFWNTVNFANTYIELDKWRVSEIRPDSLQPEDKWIIYELHKSIKEIEEYIENDEIHRAVRVLIDLIVEKISHRYIPLIRPRVWEEELSESKNAAYYTLYNILKRVIIASAPLVPFISEYLYLAFVRKLEPDSPDSVHLEEWPTVPKELLDEEVWKAVSEAFEISEAILSARSERKLKRRWPLRLAGIASKSDIGRKQLSNVKSIISRFANIKRVVVIEEFEESKDTITIETENFKVLVDLALDRETLLEGYAREVVRRMQVLRKEMDLPVDYVVEKAIVYADSDLREAIEKHEEYIKREVRVKSIEIVNKVPADAKKWKIEDFDFAAKLIP